MKYYTQEHIEISMDLVRTYILMIRSMNKDDHCNKYICGYIRVIMRDIRDYKEFYDDINKQCEVA